MCVRMYVCMCGVYICACLGTVIRSTIVKMRESSREFKCDKCHHVFTVEADVQQYYTIPRPPRWVIVMDISSNTVSHCHCHCLLSMALS